MTATTGSGVRPAGRADRAALTSVRTQMLRGAGMEADRIVAEARRQAAATLRQARHDADETVERARARGRADAATAAAAERNHGREQARSIVLGAQREAYEELCAQVLAAVGGLRNEPGYERLLGRLTAMAARTAGPGAAITVASAGGVVARSGGVLVDCTLSRLASLAVDALGDQVRALWTP